MKFSICLLIAVTFFACTPKKEIEKKATTEQVNQNSDIVKENSDQYSSDDKMLLEAPALSVKEELIQFTEKYDSEIDMLSNYISAGRRSDILDHLDELSLKARSWIIELGISKAQITNKGISNLSQLNALKVLYSKNRELYSIDGIADLSIEHLVLSRSSITNIDPLSSNEYIKHLNISSTNVDSLPDMSGMTALTELFLENTPIKSLDNIETIPSSFFLYLRNCDDLEDIDALRFSNVSGILIDNKDVAPQWVSEGEVGTYNRFEDWFDKYLPEIQERNPGFKIYFDVDDLYGEPM